ncbi:hypothetical protein POM88_023902 [Heracleum sosnowskyi]|uniref:Response regulatory domain-containing protein n=1 Tax=Heracleum sosnowskyi TaxID=360622 RepID=A0AAD8IIH3_9APIA|nr:hypothetical protein POM88_023901 [Heracleum sosnowskyi]KAK1386167.1 hypothetical protein POM88_023902 [Heracleum sosnowskyi]
MYKCLVVDDDDTWRTKMCSTLQIYEYYDVVGAKDADEALNKLRSESFDLVLCEIHLQDIDGIELMQQIHREFNLPVTLISADNRREVLVNAISKGAFPVLLKHDGMVNDFKHLWQNVIVWRKIIYDKKGKGKLDPDVGVSSNENVSILSDDEVSSDDE